MTHKMYFPISQICNSQIIIIIIIIIICFNSVRKLFRETYSVHVKRSAKNVQFFIAGMFVILYAQPFYVRCICTVMICLF